FPVSESEGAVEVALDVGFRHIDNAHLYGNEKEVGRAIQKKMADGTIKRNDVFYTGKAGGDYIPMDENGKILLDMSTDLCAIWEAMEKCKDAGLVKSIGVSNFNRRQLEKILNKPGLKHKPVLNQVECHPYLNQSKLLDYCKSKDILLAGYNVLGSHRHKIWVDQNSPVLLEDPVLVEIAKKYDKTPAHIAIRYQIQRGVVPIAKSYNPERIKENFKVFDFELTPGEMQSIDGMNRNLRYTDLKP
ncbi:hypothetical protein GDO81_018972, partial [Engystomops pustulosus]